MCASHLSFPLSSLCLPPIPGAFHFIEEIAEINSCKFCHSFPQVVHSGIPAFLGCRNGMAKARQSRNQIGCLRMTVVERARLLAMLGILDSVIGSMWTCRIEKKGYRCLRPLPNSVICVQRGIGTQPVDCRHVHIKSCLHFNSFAR